jgi:hypothetical protein
MATEPSHVTTIDQDRGAHHTGLRMTALKDVRTDFGDYYPNDRWDDLSAEEQACRAGVIEQIHKARVALESLPIGERVEAELYVYDHECDDVEYISTLYREAIAWAKVKED